VPRQESSASRLWSFDQLPLFVVLHKTSCIVLHGCHSGVSGQRHDKLRADFLRSRADHVSREISCRKSLHVRDHATTAIPSNRRSRWIRAGIFPEEAREARPQSRLASFRHRSVFATCSTAPLLEVRRQNGPSAQHAPAQMVPRSPARSATHAPFAIVSSSMQNAALSKRTLRYSAAISFARSETATVPSSAKLPFA